MEKRLQVQQRLHHGDSLRRVIEIGIWESSPDLEPASIMRILHFRTLELCAQIEALERRIDTAYGKGYEDGHNQLLAMQYAAKPKFTCKLCGTVTTNPNELIHCATDDGGYDVCERCMGCV